MLNAVSGCFGNRYDGIKQCNGSVTGTLVNLHLKDLETTYSFKFNLHIRTKNRIDSLQKIAVYLQI